MSLAWINRAACKHYSPLEYCMQVNNTVLAHVESSQDSCWHSCEDTMSAHAHLPAEAYGLWCQSRLSGESLTALTLDLPRCSSTVGMALNCANSSHESSGTQVPARSDKDVQTAQSCKDETDVMALSSCMAQMPGLQKLCGAKSEHACASDRENRAAAAAASASGEAAAATGNLSGGCHSSGTDCPAEHGERAVSVLSDGQNIKKDCESLEGKCTQRNDSAGRDAGAGAGRDAGEGVGTASGAGAGSGSCAGAGDGRAYGICEADLDEIIACGKVRAVMLTMARARCWLPHMAMTAAATLRALRQTACCAVAVAAGPTVISWPVSAELTAYCPRAVCIVTSETSLHARA